MPAVVTWTPVTALQATEIELDNAGISIDLAGYLESHGGDTIDIITAREFPVDLLEAELVLTTKMGFWYPSHARALSVDMLGNVPLQLAVAIETDLLNLVVPLEERFAVTGPQPRLIARYRM